VLAISFVVRIYSLLKDSSFNKNTFNVLIITDKDVRVLGFDEKAKKISVLTVKNESYELRKENIMIESVKLGVPLHGYIVYPNSKQPGIIDANFFSLPNLINIYLNSNIKKKNVFFLDFIKMYLVAGDIKMDTSSSILSYSSTEELDSSLPKESGEFFRDSDLSGRKTSLQVINGTSVDGLGGRIGAMFSRVGFNVVSVGTDKNADESRIYIRNNDYKIDGELVKKTFDFPIELSSEYGVASITIVIGEDVEPQFEGIE